MAHITGQVRIAAPVEQVFEPSPEQMFAPVRKHLIDWDAPAGA